MCRKKITKGKLTLDSRELHRCEKQREARRGLGRIDGNNVSGEVAGRGNNVG
jgi:hypothetical protein